MLRDWLGATSLDSFESTTLGARPHASAGTARAVVPLFDWSALERILAARPSDLLVVSRGRALEQAAPRTLAATRALFARGAGLVIRRAERVDESLSSLARAFAEDLRGEAHVQLFVTPAGTHGFGWHYDAEDVFIAQTCGSKEYFFRANTVAPSPEPGDRFDFSAIRRETSPIFSSTLVPGDWLYLPRGFWHVAKPTDDSLSISIGVARAPVLRAARASASGGSA